MDNYTTADLQEALRPIASSISKSEKAFQKLKPGTWQHTMLRDNLKALHHVSALVSKKPSGGNDLTQNDLSEAIRSLDSMINTTEQALAKFLPGTSQHTLQRKQA
jgi:hypothetical protein